MPNATAFPTGFDPSSSVLFLGSGFSVEATNIAGENPPVGDGLRTKFLELLELETSDASDLKDLAEYAFQNGNDVLKLLREQFTITDFSDGQAAILAQAWRRIYTTNYDDVVEVFHKKNRTTPKPAIYSNEDRKAKQVRTGSIIHIHGYIHRMTPDNVMRQAVLAHRSYAEQAATTSPWWQQFERDIRSAENIFFVGYSLADFETASYLTRSDDLVSKTHFILRANQSPIVRTRIESYGNLHEIAVEGFAAECNKAVVGKRPEHANMLTSLRYFDVFPDDKTPIPPTPVEIENLFTFGNFNFRRLFATFPRSEYVLPRHALLNTGADYLSANKTLVD
jgi:SIR2-like protein